MAKKTNKPPLN